MLDRLRRVTDLFVEGEPLILGRDEDGIVSIWINKLNSFEVEETKRDGQARRGLKVLELTKEGNPRLVALKAEMATWKDDELKSSIVSSRSSELFLNAMNDIETSPEWREKLEIIRRIPEQLEAEDAAADDPRRAQLFELQQEYFTATQEAIQKGMDAAKGDLDGLSRKELEDLHIERWRSMESLDDFTEGRRMSQLYYCMRDCKAAGDESDPSSLDHSACDHTQKMLKDREAARNLPAELVDRVIAKLEEITVSEREAGNLDAPETSSESSGQPTATEGPSTPSIPAETPRESLMS